VRDAFDAFVSNIPFYGLAVCCLDHPEVQALVGRIDDRRVVTYGFSRQADVRAENLEWRDGAARFDVVLREPRRRDAASTGWPCRCRASTMCRMRWPPSPWRSELGLTPEQIAKGLGQFGGVKRRFTHTGRLERGARCSTITATIRSRSRLCCRLRATPARAG
jgi:UDP-N-acetylmuramate--alanine ligase